METPLPLNETLIEYSKAVPWQMIEERKRTFNEAVKALAVSGATTAIPFRRALPKRPNSTSAPPLLTRPPSRVT